MKKPPVDIIEVFPVLNEQLISFLKSLSSADWQKQTVAKRWLLKDVAAHLLDGNFRQISLRRDKWSASVASVNSYSELVEYLNALNADWVKAAKRLSPALLIELLEQTNREVYELFKGTDPFGQAPYSVSWAGENASLNWFDIAREYTERWLHQQQMRDAVGDNGIINEELFYPFLNIVMYGWPVACAEAKAVEGALLKATITGKGGGVWFLKMLNGTWELGNQELSDTITAETIIDGTEAWKLFSKSVRKEDIKNSFKIRGDQQLGEKILDMVSVMA